MNPAPDNRQSFDGRLPPPEFVNIETTKYCNLRCRMCVQFNDGTTVTGPHMPIEEFDLIARKVFPYVRRWQPTVAGEPMMSQGFDHMIEVAESFGVKAEMFTNATLMGDKRIELLAPNLGCMSISFDGATKDTFEFIREGAEFEVVKERTQALIRYCRETLPEEEQPRLLLNCTLMERNIRELPTLVRVAAEELGVDNLTCFHMFPVTEEMRGQSLVHFRDLARKCIDEAFEVARELKFNLRIEALDQITMATAMAGGTDRAYPTKDGVVEGFEMREAMYGVERAWPVGQKEGVAENRAAGREEHLFPKKPAKVEDLTDADGQPVTTQYCKFLWQRLYVAIGGDVRPCCTHGAPVVGNLKEQSLPEIWNGEALRQMRQRIARHDPVPACKGCTHVRTITDAQTSAVNLLGTQLPTDDEIGPLNACLDPQKAKPMRAGDPPTLTWDEVPTAERYHVEVSLDEFQSVLFSTAGPRGGPKIVENRYQVPLWAWRDAPTDRTIYWRAIAKTPGEDRVCATGELPPDA